MSIIKSIRNLCDKYQTETELRVYPSGYPFLFWQQYITLRLWLFVSLAAVSGAIFVTVAISLYNAWAAFLIVSIRKSKKKIIEKQISNPFLDIFFNHHNY